MEADSSKYTVVKLWNPQHQAKLNKYMEDHKHLKKTSYCRFYLRGLCIMKNEHCKFAHDFDELRLWESQYKLLSLMECAITEKEQRKKMFIEKTDFHQRPLFFLKNLDYTWLYQYQFSPRYQLSGKEPVSQEEINRSEPIRHRIREIMHRQQWDKVLTFLETTFPEANFTIDMLSCWFARLGFEKAQTFCRFGDFMRYLVFVRGYTQVNIVVPPQINRSIYYLKSEATYMYSMKDNLIKDSEIHRTQVKKVKEERLKKMPANLQKKFICRFYMSGNCEKTREQCFYVHNFEDMRYQRNQEFLVAYRQPPKSKEDKMNYLSLYRYYCEHKTPEEPQLTLDDLNSKHGYKDRIRKQVHLQLYKKFLEKVSEQYSLQILPVSLVREEYNKMGFNHTDQNKFGQLEGVYWDLGYYPLDTLNSFKEKVHCITKVPPLEVMQKKLAHTLKIILQSELQDDDNQRSQMLQSSIRRLVYSYNEDDQDSVPLHIYLRAKKASFKNVLQEMVPEYCPRIFFESVQDNFKKLMEMVKKWLKKRKKPVQRFEDIDGYVKGLSKDEINLNSLVNYKRLLQLGLLETGKEMFFFPLANASLVIDRTHLQQKHIQFKKSNPLPNDMKDKFNDLMNQRIVVVNNEGTLEFCTGVLKSCFKFGIDLEGRLSLNGYIDLVQISCINQKKFIFVIDIYLLKKEKPSLYDQAVLLLKEILEDHERVKIMHSCQQDAVALWSCMDICLKGLFDTSGTHIYIQQRQLYFESLKNSPEHILRVLHKTKTPGLNQILESWGAPNGKNNLKERMKKIFSEAGRDYFQKRPIQEEFLQYSARDVEDLIEVQENMIKQDPEGLWIYIGQIYASFRG